MLFPEACSHMCRPAKAGTFLLPVAGIAERFRWTRGAVDRLNSDDVPRCVDRSASATARYRLTHSEILVAIPWNSMRYSSMVIGITPHERGSSPWSSHRTRSSIPGRSLGRDPPQRD
jgi:hypothetical protein